MESSDSSCGEKIIPWAHVLAHIDDVDNYLEEILAIKKKLRSEKIEKEEAQMLNSKSIVKFHQTFTEFLL